MRPMRRKDRQISREEALDLMKSCEYAVLSTIGAEDGAPYGVPVSPAVADGFIYVHCALKGYKLDSILRDPRVCLTCVGRTRLVPEEFATDYESAIAFGTAHLVETDEERIFALRKICEKYAASNLENFDREIEAALSRTAVLKISIDEISGKARQTEAS